MSTSPERMRYETFVLGGEDDSIVHLRSRLPEVVALGTEAALEFIHHTPPLGGPHATWSADLSSGTPGKLSVETPECTFIYQVMAIKADAAGWYFLMKRIYVSDAYHAWVETL